jgi:arylsulfatase A-like enzyme
MKRRLPAPQSLTRREFITRSTLAAGFLGLHSNGLEHILNPGRSDAGKKPNIILIVADDLGYGELGCQGNKEIPTPHIDSIARNGVRFTNGYVTAPLCSPSRAGLLTGRYQQRFGHEFNPGQTTNPSTDFGLPLSETLLPARLKELGYKTGMVGKCHLGLKPEFLPINRGFDEFFGFLGGAHSYVGNDVQKGTVLRGSTPVPEKEYLTDAFAREAEAFIEKHHDKPFFLYLPFNAVHMPLQSIQKYLDRFGNIKDGKRKTFAAMISAMDDAVGRVIERVRKHKLEENTLIFFISDNGGPTLTTTSGNLPLRGYKAQVLEGGIRLPFMMQWKGRLPAGKVYHHPVSSLDIHPTAIAAAGGAIKPEMNLDGVDLSLFMTGTNPNRPHETLCWRMGEKQAIRHGDWKLIKEQGEIEWSLYNLAEDAGEEKNLAAKMPEKVKELKSLYGAWEAQLQDPKWIRQNTRRTRTRQAARQSQAETERQLENRFKRLDRNGDGKLSADEANNAPRFRGADLNGDGVITMEEAKKHILKK